MSGTNPKTALKHYISSK